MTRTKQSKKSKLEKKFELYWRGMFPGVKLAAEHRFDPPRKWRFDFAHLSSKVAIELEGGIWSGGRHNRPSGFLADCLKYNHATFLGWAVVRLPETMITTVNLEQIAKLIVERMP